MKKLLCMLLALSMVLALTSCGGNNKPAVDPEAENEIEVEDVTENNESKEDVVTDETEEEVKEEDKTEDTPSENKTEDKTEPVKKPETSTSKPAEKPAEKPVEKPATPPAEKPAEPQTPPANNPPAAETPSSGKTLGDTLAEVWRANSSKSTEEIANAVISHSSIQFMGGVVPVEEGFLTGFDNAEIKGFSSGHMFAPAIGTIAFVGYAFELAEGTDADAFVKMLKNSANPRWNICTEAEQTIVEKNGNKVFFLMCPKSLEE